MTPVVDDRDTSPFFAAAAEGRLVYCACSTCGKDHHPPVPMCANCGSHAMIWRESAGIGTVACWTVIHRGFAEGFKIPYTVAMITLDDAPAVRLTAHLAGEPVLQAGQSMQVWFEARADGVTLPQWRPCTSA